MPSLAVSVGSACTMPFPVISIDGPVGSGKTTVGHVVADRHGYVCLDSGIFYRAAALLVLRSKIDSSDVRQVVRLVKSLDLSFPIGYFWRQTRWWLAASGLGFPMTYPSLGSPGSDQFSGGR